MWEASIGKGLLAKNGILQYLFKHFKCQFEVNQPLNLDKKLKIIDLQLDLGEIQIKSDGLGSTDYLLELVTNIIPSVLRPQIMDALEKRITNEILYFSNNTGIETLIREKFEEYQKSPTAVKSAFKLEL